MCIADPPIFNSFFLVIIFLFLLFSFYASTCLCVCNLVEDGILMFHHGRFRLPILVPRHMRVSGSKPRTRV